MHHMLRGDLVPIRGSRSNARSPQRDTRSLVGVTRRSAVSWTTDSSQIMTGDEVYGSDGDKVGTVAEVQPSYIVVEKGFFFPTDYYIPMSAIASVAGGQVYLNVAKDAALNSGWDTVPDAVSAATPGTETILTK